MKNNQIDLLKVNIYQIEQKHFVLVWLTFS